LWRTCLRCWRRGRCVCNLRWDRRRCYDARRHSHWGRVRCRRRSSDRWRRRRRSRWTHDRSWRPHGLRRNEARRRCGWLWLRRFRSDRSGRNWRDCCWFALNHRWARRNSYGTWRGGWCGSSLLLLRNKL
jgi:hypothetical protein